MSFITVSQCKQIVRNYLSASGRGGFLTGTVQSVAPLTVLLESGLPLYAADLYITGHCRTGWCSGAVLPRETGCC